MSKKMVVLFLGLLSLAVLLSNCSDPMALELDADVSEDVTLTKVIDHESENNNYVELSDTLRNNNTLMQGEIEAWGAVDWFKVTVPSGGKQIRIQLWGSDTYVTARFYKSLFSSYVDIQEGDTRYITVSPGTYYIKLSGYSGIDYYISALYFC